MKKLAFCILSLLLLLLLYNFWWNGNWYDNIMTSMNSSTGCITGTVSCQEFEASNIPDNTDIFKNNNPYHYAWFFSDGTFDRNYFTTSISDNTLEIVQPFPSTNYNNTLLQLVPTYDDKDKPKQFNIGNPNFHTADPATLTSGFDLHLYHFLNPRRGDSLIYVLQYGNEYSSQTEGYAQLKFDKDAMQIDMVYVFNNETVTTTLATANADGKLKIDYSGLAPGNYRNIFVEFKFPENANENIEEVSFPLELFAKEDTLEPHIVLDTLVLNYLQSSTPHDPNHIMADKSEICPLPIPDYLTYTIVFQNIGKGNCKMVTVKEILPVNFLLDAVGSDIQVLEPPGLPFTVNTKTREITWKMTKNDMLKYDGTNGKELMGTDALANGHTEDDTKDSIVFQVKFDKNIPLIPCSAIPNRAEIIFEDLEPIVTNDYIATIKCTNCDSCTTTPGIEVLPAIKTKKGKAVTLTLPKNKTQFATHYTWYPPLGLDDPGSATPKATLNKNTVYTAIASGGCRQEIFKVPVMVTAKAKCACKGFWHCLWRCKWWLLFIILALIAWLLLRRRGGEA